ncbi:DmsC/YnfH family molybdoenzyme membrane anchor subunit, partial [Klebsiella pneumoniae]|uniref:DmsC/YnfH family molybdoenzyme membrane anchor subunit n=1 Tax=Klebsiella pneumoniae TaxID=573 RepID=UPI001BABDA8A
FRAWRVALLPPARACWCVPHIRARKPAVSLLALAFVLIMAGEMIARGVFYGLHMIVGMAVASYPPPSCRCLTTGMMKTC